MQRKKYLMTERKVAIIGIGYVGASIAYALAIRNLTQEIVLIDIDKNKATGEALDIQHGIPYMGISNIYEGDYSDCAECDLIIITAGRNRRNNETRLNLVNDNTKIMEEVVRNIKPYYTKGVILVVSNPVDILAYKCSKLMGLPNGRVFGTGCLLDTSRLIRCISDYTSLNTDVIKAFVVGEHGDAQVPIWSRLSIAGVPMEEYCASVGLSWTEEDKNIIYKKVKDMGAEIIKGKGKTHFGIATCVCYLADAVLNQRLTIASVSTPLQGEYGVEGVSLSVPSIIGVNGVEKRIEEKWTTQEYNNFLGAAEKIRSFLS